MKPLTRDIVITLTVKLMLLFALWWVCFKHVEKPSRDPHQWLIGAGSPQISKVDKSKSM